jgi:hypothetical protein
MGLFTARRAGEPSGILSIRTGLVLMCSLTISYMKLQGALVLMDPPSACERETLYPPFRSAELDFSIVLLTQGR